MAPADERWLFDSYHPNGYCRVGHDIAPVRTVASGRVTIMSSPAAFHIVDFMPEGQTMDRGYFMQNILEPLASIFYRGGNHRLIHRDTYPI
jgi:hypothetical protein